MKRIVCLIGGGSRLPAIINYTKENSIAKIVGVISHKKEAKGIDIAKNENLQAEYFRWVDYKTAGRSREEWEQDLLEKVKALKPDLIVLAGWMMLLSDRFLGEFPYKVINIHPALNPAFPGAHGIDDALAYGSKVTGATVHFVPDAGVDSGPIIEQDCFQIEQDDNYDSIRSKMDTVEDRILVKAIDLFCRDSLKIQGRKVIIE